MSTISPLPPFSSPEDRSFARLLGLGSADAEISASVTPVDYSIPSYATCGYVDPRRYGYLGDGVANDWGSIQSAVAVINELGGGILWFPPGTTPRIYVGTQSGTLCAFTNCLGVHVLGYGVTLTVDLTRAITASIGQCFVFSGCTNVLVDGFSTNGPTLDVSQTAVKGVEFVTLQGGTRNVHLGVNRVKNWLAGLKCDNQVSGLPGDESLRSQNITVDVLDIENCWYGINNQFSGDNMKVHCLRTNGIHRSFFIYGCRKIDADIWSKDHHSVDLLLDAVGGVECADWTIRYHSTTDSTNCSTGAAKVQLLFAGTSAQKFRNINIELDVEYPTSGTTNGGAAFDIHKVDASGNSVALDYGHILDGLRVSGRIKGQGSSSVSSSGTISTNFASTWGTGDFFSNICFDELSIEAVNDSGIPRLCFGNVTDVVTLRNVSSNVCFNIRHSNSDASRPRTAKIDLLGVRCPNRDISVVDTNGNNNAALTRCDAASAAETVYSGHCNSVLWTNQNVGADTVLTLPSGFPGARLRFCRVATGRLSIDPSGTEVVRGGGAGKKYFTDSAGGYTELEWMQAAGPWEIKQQVGTWSFEP